MGFHILTYRKGPYEPGLLRRSAPTGSRTASATKPSTCWRTGRCASTTTSAGTTWPAARSLVWTRPAGTRPRSSPPMPPWPPPRWPPRCSPGGGRRTCFRFVRPRGLDAMDSYAKVPDDPARLVPEPGQGLHKNRAGRGSPRRVGRQRRSDVDCPGGPSRPRPAPSHKARQPSPRQEPRVPPSPPRSPSAASDPTRCAWTTSAKRRHDAVRMLRPASWTKPAGVSPVRVGAGAPGSRPRSVVERSRAERGVKSLFGGSKRAGRSAIRRESCSLVTVTTGEPSRSCHGEGPCPTCWPVPEMPLVGSLRGTGSGTYARFRLEQERPVWCGLVSKDRRYKPVVKSGGAQRESDGVVVPLIAGMNPAGGKEPPTSVVLVEEVSVRAWPGPPGPSTPTGVSVRSKCDNSQNRLWAAAKQSEGRRFHALYDPHLQE